MGNADRILWEMARSDIQMELNTEKTSTITEIFSTIFEVLRSLNCDVSYLKTKVLYINQFYYHIYQSIFKFLDL